jgi:hypothetical protein
MRAGMALGNAQISHEQRDRLGNHRPAAIGMDRQLVGLNLLFGAGLRDEEFGQRARVALSELPPDHVAAENVEHHVQVVIGPLGWAEQVGDVPTPDLIGLRRQQFRLGIGRMAQLVTTLAHFRRSARMRYIVLGEHR